MVELDQLAEEARRTAEWSRLRMGLRVTGVIAVFTAGAIAGGGAVIPCVCLGLTLLVASVTLRWWSREGVDAVHLGVMMGAVPLLAAMLLSTCGVACAPPGAVGGLELACVVAGVVAGVGLAWFPARRQRPWRTWMLSTAVAMLTAMLGCVALGATGLAVTVAAVLVVSTSVRIPLVLRAA